MITRSVATVFGGSGFIGRYVVKRLAAQGHVVRVAVRAPQAALFLKPMGAVGQIVPLAASIGQEAEAARAIEGADWVVNLVGILAEDRSGDFARVHTEGAQRVARLAAAAGVSRLVHLSALGADPNSASRYGASKGEGERAVLAAFPAATILRPGIVFGPEDHFFNRFAEMARMLPFLPVISGNTRLQPVYVGDVADAVMAALTREGVAGGIYELGGPKVQTMRELLAYILQLTGRDRKLISIPPSIARLQARFLQHFPGKPLTPDQLKMLETDNVVSPGAKGLAEFGLVATPIDLIVPGYLKRYRPGGGTRPIP